MRLSPDEIIFWQHGFFKLNATIVFTWLLILVLTVGSKLITHKLSIGLKRARWQNLLEIVAAASLCAVIPGYEPPTGSLSTTAALALCVFVAVPFFGVREHGVGNYCFVR